MNERNLIPEAIEYLSKSDEERILFCKKDHWIGYGAAVKLIEILEINDNCSSVPITNNNLKTKISNILFFYKK